MKTIGIFLTALAILNACETENLPQTENKINVDKTTREIIQADNDFGITLFKEVAASDAEADNVFISPTSVALALAMTYNGAGGDTKTAMENTLRKAGFTLEEINQSYKSLMGALVSVDPGVLLEIANSIWYRQDFSVLPDFISVNSTYYQAQVNSLDFSDPLAKIIINNWVKENTHEKIAEIIDQIPEEAVMYLINAIYFKGIWRSEFDREKTADKVFTTGEGLQITVPMMQQQDTFRYARYDNLSCVELPYGQGNFNMIILLPETGVDIQEIIAALTPESWNSIIQSLSDREVVIQLPRFKFEYKNTLNDELTGMGMGLAFSDQADFSKISSPARLAISRVLHKTFVEVNEEGTEAAAVTAVEIVNTSIGETAPPVFFFVNRPFVFAIRESDTGAIVFMGSVKNPGASANE